VKLKRTIVAPYNKHERLLIKDTQKVKRKLAHFIEKGGLNNLCILTDFDYTLTRYSIDEGQNKLHASFDCITYVSNIIFI
jgi:microsomal dipeptidase-like Zn-dependent dipeptidase